MALSEAEELELLELEEAEASSRQSRTRDRSFEVPTPSNLDVSRQQQARARQTQPDRGPIPGARALTGERAERLFGPTVTALTSTGGAILGAPLALLG